jgi:hypothetical protein
MPAWRSVDSSASVVGSRVPTLMMMARCRLAASSPMSRSSTTAP